MEEGKKENLKDFKIYSDDACTNLVVNRCTEIDLAALKKIFREMKTSGEIKPTLIYLNPEITIEKEARDYMNKINRRYHSAPVAIVTKTLNETLIANFYKKFYKPENPLSIFRNKAEALKWINEAKN